ncbi:MAG: GIY-YIG nuclease family protein [Planctomycetia bacterium]|nr:GIY-YIG nuclease family protein [Planctomycetia bacterium]
MRGMRKNFDISQLPNYMSYFITGRNRGFTYFLVSDDLSLVKIGGTNDWEIEGDTFTFDADQRVSAIRRGCPVPLRLAAMVSGVPYGNEGAFHRYFKSYRYSREWYWCLDALEEYIEKIAAYSEKMDKYLSDNDDYQRQEKEAAAQDRPFNLPMPIMPLQIPVLDFGTPPPPPKAIPTGWTLQLP